MMPNKLLTSGSPLQIPSVEAQRPPSGSGNSSETPHSIATRDPAQEHSDFSAANLSREQVAVLRAIASGKGITAAAQEAGVNRSTIYRWQRDPHFQQCLAAWQYQTKDSGRNILLTLIERAARTVERALEKDHVRVAVTLLSKLGVLAASPLNKVEGLLDPVQGRPLDVAQGRSSDVAQDRPLDVAQGRPASNSVKDSAAAHPDSDPDDLTKLHAMINELETKFGDMLPGGRR